MHLKRCYVNIVESHQVSFMFCAILSSDTLSLHHLILPDVFMMLSPSSELAVRHSSNTMNQLGQLRVCLDIFVKGFVINVKLGGRVDEQAVIVHRPREVVLSRTTSGRRPVVVFVVELVRIGILTTEAVRRLLVRRAEARQTSETLQHRQWDVTFTVL